MPSVFKSSPDSSFVRIIGTGVLTDDEILESVREMYRSDEETRRHRCALMDFSRVERVDVTSDTVRELARLNLAASRLVPPGAAVAIVAPLPLAYGLGRMWEALAHDTGWRTRVFEHIREADQWLEEHLAHEGPHDAEA